jgi:hypothetical protein
MKLSFQSWIQRPNSKESIQNERMKGWNCEH